MIPTETRRADVSSWTRPFEFKGPNQWDTARELIVAAKGDRRKAAELFSRLLDRQGLDRWLATAPPFLRFLLPGLIRQGINQTISAVQLQQGPDRASANSREVTRGSSAGHQAVGAHPKNAAAAPSSPQTAQQRAELAKRQAEASRAMTEHYGGQMARDWLNGYRLYGGRTPLGQATRLELEISINRRRRLGAGVLRRADLEDAILAKLPKKAGVFQVSAYLSNAQIQEIWRRLQ